MKNSLDKSQMQVKTSKPNRPGATPRMPHENDESPDSQTSHPRKIMQQAAKDLERGLVDTSRTGIQGQDDPERIHSQQKDKK